MQISDVKALGGQLAVLLLWVSGLYASLLLLSFVLVPGFKSDVIDTTHAWNTPFSTSQKLVFYGREALVGPKKRVIILGASNAQLGFSASHLSEQIPGHAVHNLSVVSANATVIREMTDLVEARIGPEEMAGDVYVIAVWYGNFVSDAYRWGAGPEGPVRTLLESEARRFGLAKQTEDGYELRVPERNLNEAQFFAHPLLAMDRLIRVLTRTRTFPTESEMDSMVITDASRERNRETRKQETGGLPLSDAQFALLTDTISHLNARGAKVVLVSLPLPKWHRDSTSYHADYMTRIMTLVRGQDANPDFTFVDLGDLDNEDWFFDDAHLRPAYREVWSNRIAPAVRAMLEAGETALENEGET